MAVSHPVVRLSASASVRGRVVQAGDGACPVNLFCGIPYAKPPVGKLRFRPTEPVELWQGQRDCTEFGPICPQPVSPQPPTFEDIKRSLLPIVRLESSEDCLFLNVWSPNLDPNAKLAVIVWIHGGSFLVGSGDTYEGSAIAGMNEVVYVSINYRVGLFGFLTSGDDVAPGNYGLLDQVEALKWVKSHISKFGGDPDNVTLIGQSAGGMSASLHTLSDLSRGLFHKAICQSGTANSTFVARTQQQERAALRPGLEQLGYSGNTSEELLEFLQSKSPEELLAAFDRLFKVVIDGHFLTDYPHNLLQRGQAHAVPVMAGHATHEANAMISLCRSPDLLHGVGYQPPHDDQRPVREYVREIAEYAFSENIDAVTDALLDAYPVNKKNPYETVIEICSDVMFTSATHEFARMHAGNASMYVYIFAHRPSYTEVPAWMHGDHSDDTAYTLGFPFLAPPNEPRVDYTEEEKQFSKLFMTYLTNFAKTGDPNNAGTPNWPRYTPDGQEYLLLKPRPQPGAGYKPDKMRFWQHRIPQVDTGRIYT